MFKTSYMSILMGPGGCASVYVGNQVWTWIVSVFVL